MNEAWLEARCEGANGHLRIEATREWDAVRHCWYSDGQYLIEFEHDEDAVAFKLRYS